MQQRRRRYAYFQKSWSADFIPRTLFYWAKLYIEGFKEGWAYTSLTKCITINLVSEGFKLNTQVHSVYRILEQKNRQLLTDLLEIHFLNLALASQERIPAETIEKEQKLINWLQFINTDDREIRNMLAMTSPILQMLNEQIDVLTLSPVERKLYESRMKLKSDITTISETQFSAGVERGKSLGLAEGIEQGRSEGIEQGSRQKALETACILKQFGDSVQKIAQATGLTKEEIEKL